MEAGLSIPEDIAFVGCGNVRYSDFLRVPLSSIDQSTSLLGEHAGNLALELIADRKGAPRKIRVEPVLVVRASSVGASAGAATSPRLGIKRRAST